MSISANRLSSLCFRLAWIAPGLAAALSGRALEVPSDHFVPLTPENAIIGHFSKTKAPVLTIRSGEVVRFDGGGGTGWGREATEADADAWLKANGIDATVESCPPIREMMRVLKETPRAPGIPGGHFITGPVYIEDAEPGDSLEVRVLKVTPRIPWGTNGARPGGGGLPDLVPRPFEKVYKIDLKRNAAIYDDKVEFPLRAFNGVMATCPPDSELPDRKSGPPGVFGGNLDWKDMGEGATLYLPVFQKGALFYTGDCHASQGDGEVAGNAIGTANTAIYQFILHKGKMLKGPRAETPTHYILFGLDPDLDQAMRNALTEALDFLKETRGYDFVQAYTMASAGAVDLHVTQVVDGILGVHARIPKRIFVQEPDSYWYRPRHGSSAF
ncbi:acetamidase [Opitutaceae bacterium TAV5]|nr:acetamidase [Opitutaceae bacterium TAV5]